MENLSIKTLLTGDLVNQELIVKGWVRTKRGNKNVGFIALNDGSTIHNIQVVVDHVSIPEEFIKDVTTGACIEVRGLMVASQGKGQTVEIQAKEIKVLGLADESFPLQKKGHSLEFLREIAHLRPRTNTFGAIFRIRHHLTYAIHQFFNDRGFFNIHTPIITASDAEGAGEMFKVTTLDLQQLPKTPEGEINYKEDFFGRSTNLTVSGQLEGELAAMALGKVYTFGPTFRAENSNTPRHLAEFWMIEPEMAFADIHANMDTAEALLKHLINYVLDKAKDDLEFLTSLYDKELLNKLNHIVASPFQRITYTQAIEVLQAAKVKFEFKPQWGHDLQKEHETHLVDHYKVPVIVTDYPKEIKAFYMKQNEDGKTVRAMDILFPYVGEMVGGSQREESYEKLKARMEEMHIPVEGLDWYLDTRRFGACEHSGFGLGFERLILFITGMTNVRDVIPFPRTPKSANF